MADLPRLRRARLTDEGLRDEVERNLDDLGLVAEQLADTPIVNGRLIEDLSLSTTDTVIPHSLGRVLKGWIVTDVDDASVGIERSATITDDAVNLILVTSAGTTTASIWVF